MAIPTSRTHEAAAIAIDTAACTGCGQCVAVCKDFGLALADGKATLSGHPLFGCIGCGHCMAVCPHGAITVSGRTLSPADCFPLPPRSSAAGYDALLALLQRRRSIREFRAEPVAPGLLAQVLAAAQTAPMGLPPSDVHVLVLSEPAQVRQFAVDFCAYLESQRWLVSPWLRALMRPLWGQATADLMRDFVVPLFRVYTEAMQRGENLVTYDAPAALYFYGTPYCDPADPLIAATYAMLAAESLGLGTCMLGAIHPLIQYGPAARRFRAAHGIRSTSREGLFLILGQPRVSYQRALRRSFASVTYGT